MKLNFSAISLAALAVGILSFGPIIPPPAAAADLRGSMKDSPTYEPEPARGRSWSGFFVGVEAGGGFGIFNATSDTDREYDFYRDTKSESGTVRDSTNFLSDHKTSNIDLGYDGFFGGLNAEYLMQRGNVVFGITGNFDIGNMKGSATESREIFLPANIGDGTNPQINLYNDTTSLSVEQKWNGDLLLKLGITPSRDTLLFIEGGASWARFNLHGSTEASLFDNGEASPGLALPSAQFSDEETRLGWKIGVGASTFLSDHVVGSLIADYADYGSFKSGGKGSKDYPLGDSGYGIAASVNHGADVDLTGWSVKGRISYQFGN